MFIASHLGVLRVIPYFRSSKSHTFEVAWSGFWSDWVKVVAAKFVRLVDPEPIS